MASNKEILEAQRFNRRRLVTAFTSGTPGGRELEPRSHTRPLVIGAVLAVVMLGVAAIMGRLSPTLPDGWEDSTVIVATDTGARYYTVDGVLRPLTNITSGRLLSETGSYSTSTVKSGTLAGIPRGSQVGLAEAPDDVPAPASLHSDLWESCASPAGTRTWIGAELPDAAPASTAVVSADGHLFVLADGVRHQIPDEARSQVLLALDLDSSTVHEVSGDWLSLFPGGSDLAPLDVEGAGLPAEHLAASAGAAVTGSVLEVDQDASARHYLVNADGTISPLSDLTLRLYQAGPSGSLADVPIALTLTQLSSLTVDPDGLAPADWPASVEAPALGADRTPCAQLVVSGEASATSLISVPIDEDDPALPSTGRSAGGTDSGAAAVTVTVAGGSGALVRSTSGGALGAVMLITDAGSSFGLGDDPTDTLARLGYTDQDIVAVPEAWTSLVPAGIPLSAQAAWDTVAAR